MENLLRGEGNEHRHRRSGKSALYLNAVDTQGQSRHEAVLLLKVQPHQGAVIFLRHACRTEKVILQLLLAVRKVHHQEGHQEHSLISALQITEDILCLACVGGKVSGDDIHIETFPHRLFLRVDLHTVNVGDLPLDRFDCLVLIHAADMEADKQPAVRIQQLGEHTVIHFRCADLQKGHGTEFIRHRELPCFTEAERRWCDKILDRQAGRGKPAPFKGKPFPVRVQDAVEHFQPLLAAKLLCQSTHDLEMVEGVHDDPGKSCPCGFAVPCLDGEGQVLCFDKTVVAPFKLLAEHLRVKLTDMVEVISLRRDLDTLHKILPVHAAAHKGELHPDRSVMGVIHIAEGFKDRRLIVRFRKLIIHILELDTLRPGVIVQLAQAVRVHLAER